MQRCRFLPVFLFGAALLTAKDATGQGKEPEEDPAPPIRALLVTGGSNHPYELQHRILTAGIRQRISRVIEWKVHHQGQGRSDVRIPLFENPNWAEGYDIVVHNYCFPRVYDAEYIQRIIQPHADGVPAVLIHAAVQSFRPGDDRWTGFAGALSRGQAPVHPVAVSWEGGGDPVVSGLPPWTTPKDTLYLVESLLPTAKVLGYGTTPGNEGNQPVAWRHRFGPKQTRVFATTLGNDPETMMESPYLDLVTRGFLWALDRLEGEDLREVEDGGQIPGVSMPEAPVEVRKPGRNLASSAAVSAFSSNVADGFLPDLAIDGDPFTYWESETVGPASCELVLDTPSSLAAIVIEWKDKAPAVFSAEARSDTGAWGALPYRSDDRSASDCYIPVPGSELMDRIRITVPATGPGERVGIREIAVYQREADVPAAYALDRIVSPEFHAIGPGDEERTFRLRKGWIHQAHGDLPRGSIPVQLIHTASGDFFVVVKEGNGDSEQILHGRRVGEQIVYSVFLGNLPSGTTAAWDGEWLYVLSGMTVTAYRDTNDDGTADERFGAETVFTPRDETAAVPPVAGLQLTIDGWCYGLVAGVDEIEGFTGEGDLVTLPKNALVRFRRDGSGFETVWQSKRTIVDFFHGPGLRLFVALENENGAAEYHRLSSLAGGELPPGNRIPLVWSREWKTAPAGNDSLRILQTRNGLACMVPSQKNESAGEAVIVAETGGPVLLDSERCGLPGEARFLIERKGKWRLESLSTGAAPPQTIDLDTVPDRELLPLLGEEEERIRKEAAFEITRRRMDLTEELVALLDRAGSSSRISALAVLARTPGRDSFQELIQAARSSTDPVVFHFLGDRPEARNHRIFSRITRVKSPPVTAAILAAMEKSGTDVSGLDEFCLSMVSLNEPELANAARSFLIRREAAEACFAALDSAGKSKLNEAAFSVLSGIFQATVAEGIVLRLEQTKDPVFRKSGLDALCQLYFRGGIPGAEWKSTPLIHAFLQASLSDHRVDREWLIDRLLDHGIPVNDSKALVELARENSSLEPWVLARLENLDPDIRIDSGWLRSLAESESRDKKLRNSALRLLLPQNELPYRTAFSLARTFLEKEREPEEFKRICRAWGKVVCPDEQVAWLPQHATSGDSVRSTLAWISLLSLREQESGGAHREKIDTTLAKVQSPGASGKEGLLRAAIVVPAEEVEKWIAESSQSENTEVREASRFAAVALDRDVVSGKPLDPPPEETNHEIAGADWSKVAGSVELGWEVFQREGCHTCHNIHGEGFLFGPDLVEVVRTISAADFAASVLRPEVRVESGYGSFGFELTNGVRIRGIVESRSDSVIRLRDTGGNAVELPVERVRWEWASTEPLMHATFGESLSARELASLKALLLHLGGS